ncbi:MAG: glycosyltransferase [Actinomycetaceae bacterium]|nr:glycosyltransferase [Actinomycetaceae bacterium]
MSQPLVSVVVPVYNVEDYVSTCVDSLLSQTYPNLEILLVDDGSTDKSGSIIDTFSDPRLRVFHQENGGLSSARNFGLEHANGEFLCFVDSDDVVREDFVESMLNVALVNDCDLVICDLIGFVDEQPPSLDRQPVIAHPIARDDAIDCLYQSDSLVRFTVAVTKLYRQDLYTTLRFPHGKLHEDVAVALPIILSSHRIYELDSALYFYRDNPRSIMNSPSWAHLDGLVFYEEHYRTLEKMGHPAAKSAQLAAFKTAISNLVDFSRDQDKKSTKRFHHLLSHVQYLARRIEVHGLRPRDVALVLVTRVCPRTAISIYTVALHVRNTF